MPCLEEHPKVAEVGDTEQQPAMQEQTEPHRELTQTDLLNNRLLKSFLNRINSGDIANKFNNQHEIAQNGSEFDD